MFRKYVDTLSLQDHDALTHHERPRTIVHNNIFGGEGAKRFQPQRLHHPFFRIQNLLRDRQEVYPRYLELR